MIARLLAKDKGDIIHWYEIVKEVKTNKKGRQRIVKGYSITPEDISIELYKEFLILKLKDTLDLVGLNLSELGCNIPQINEQSSPLDSC